MLKRELMRFFFVVLVFFLTPHCIKRNYKLTFFRLLLLLNCNCLNMKCYFLHYFYPTLRSFHKQFCFFLFAFLSFNSIFCLLSLLNYSVDNSKLMVRFCSLSPLAKYKHFRNEHSMQKRRTRKFLVLSLVRQIFQKFQNSLTFGPEA